MLAVQVKLHHMPVLLILLVTTALSITLGVVTGYLAASLGKVACTDY